MSGDKHSKYACDAFIPQEKGLPSVLSVLLANRDLSLPCLPSPLILLNY